ncbi:vs.1 hypothetical protein [Aeromonas phage 31]|uniref:Uncharacterized protein vs.1 n=2 Tax=Biquartavirus TaxID=1912143 RepID=Q56EQ6_9CAUD|nr:hypothetical protein PHG31p105 [Aeromonas phage 31]AAX63594.1 vs.1 hypothetical protein [Aeromonas phage 31]UYD59659.1 hypothetical protein JNMOADIG_00130 [Aeromonas phage avDM5]UYD60367.1 hypothetical protein NPHMPGLK_00032 [Aeromonas phage avDM2]UYD60797.1 hypothetical protein NHNEHLNL_00201 [Aeromonas phage avDM2]
MRFLAILILLFTSHVFAGPSAPDFTDTQKTNLSYAYYYGKGYDLMGNQRDVDHPNFLNQRHLGTLFAAIAWEESSAGLNTGRSKKGHHAYGMFQNLYKTVVKKMDQRGIPFRHWYLKKDLETRSGSAEWAMDELHYWLTVRKGNIRLALASYNAGWNYKAGLGYADRVLSKNQRLKSMEFIYK